MDEIQRWEKPRFLASIQPQKLILFQSSLNKCSLYQSFLLIYYPFQTLNSFLMLYRMLVISMKLFSYNPTTATNSRPTFYDFHNPGFCFYSLRSFRWWHQLLIQLVKWKVVYNHDTLFNNFQNLHYTLKSWNFFEAPWYKKTAKNF